MLINVSRCRCLLLGGLLLARAASAGPWMEPGDSALRHDIQLLADVGVIRAPVTAWPMSWPEIAESLRDAASYDLSGDEMAALARRRRRARAATVTDELELQAWASLAENPRRIRNFEDGPREDRSLGITASWMGNRFALRLSGEYVDDPEDGKHWRADGSYAGVVLGNWMLAASLTDRWWGPAWHSSLILSNNARPIPAITLGRNITTPFKTKWLRWMGNWDFSMIWGQLESDRFVPDPNFLGLRLTFRPTEHLEIGLNRTALWCGDGRSCNAEDFFNLLLGRDNRGDNISAEKEPGDQLAGFDLRWSGKLAAQAFALYLQLIAEDQGDIRPTKNLGLFGVENWGNIGALGSYRIYLEWANTECDFERHGNANCAYNHSIFHTGYRYRGRSIGSSLDNDASVVTLGGVFIDQQENSWLATFNIGLLNRVGAPDSRNTVAEVQTRYRELEISHRRTLPIGILDAGLGFEYRKNAVTREDDGDLRLFLRWRTGF